MPTRKDLLRLIEDEADEHLHFLSSLIRIPSPNPPGGTQAAIHFVQNHLSSRGLASEIIAPKNESPNLLSTLHGQRHVETHQGRRLVLNGHIDHFPCSSDEKWERDPYSGDITEQFVHGLGAVDMKAGTAASIIAYTYVQRLLSEVSGHCTLEVVSDEETGGRYGTRYLIEHDARKEEWRGDCVLNAEPSGIESIRLLRSPPH
jgi:succinyl-diaminopimelate desuccinylase